MSHERRRVLVVDHDPVAGLRIDRQLEALGWESVYVSNAAGAIGIVTFGFIIDVLLTHIAPPDLDGLTLARLVTKRSPSTRVAFMSDEMTSTPRQPRDVPLLLKPFTTIALADALAGAISVPPNHPAT